MINKQFDLWVNCCYFVKVFMIKKIKVKKVIKFNLIKGMHYLGNKMQRRKTHIKIIC
jgi:hypothetical protein